MKDCPLPATVRIETYSPRDGRTLGFREQETFACVGHAADVVAEVVANGFTAHRQNVARSQKRCGYTFVYRSGGVR